jgi:hypothetical protein
MMESNNKKKRRQQQKKTSSGTQDAKWMKVFLQQQAAGLQTMKELGNVFLSSLTSSLNAERTTTTIAATTTTSSSSVPIQAYSPRVSETASFLSPQNLLASSLQMGLVNDVERSRRDDSAIKRLELENEQLRLRLELLERSKGNEQPAVGTKLIIEAEAMETTQGVSRSASPTRIIHHIITDDNADDDDNRPMPYVVDQILL